MLNGIQSFPLTWMLLKMSSAKWRPFCSGLNELTDNTAHDIILNFGDWLYYVKLLMTSLKNIKAYLISLIESETEQNVLTCSKWRK